MLERPLHVAGRGRTLGFQLGHIRIEQVLQRALRFTLRRRTFALVARNGERHRWPHTELALLLLAGHEPLVVELLRAVGANLEQQHPFPARTAPIGHDVVAVFWLERTDLLFG